MRRLLLIGLLLQFAVFPLNAQRSKWLQQTGRALQTPVHTFPGKYSVSRQLNKRLEQSYRQAQKTLQEVPPGQRIPIGEPALQGIHVQKLQPAEIYPQVPFLTTPQQTARYFLARNNRLFVQERKRMEKVWSQIDSHLPALLQEAQQLEQPTHLVSWLANTIPSGIDHLFLGESHGYPEVRKTVQALLPLLRQKFPQRQIFLFTEFFPQDTSWGNLAHLEPLPPHLQVYFPVWQSAAQAHIDVIGLEPISVIRQDDCDCKYLSSTGQKNRKPFWSTLEGVRWRNEKWQQTLANYRAQYPDALFIIYAGADHILYNRPFSLSANYPKQTSFVAAIHPNRKPAYSASNWWGAAFLTAQPYSDSLEEINQQLEFPQPVLRWSAPELSQITGFDARLKIPVRLEEIDY